MGASNNKIEMRTVNQMLNHGKEIVRKTQETIREQDIKVRNIKL